jgi:hypothetical protein
MPSDDRLELGRLPVDRRLNVAMMPTRPAPFADAYRPEVRPGAEIPEDVLNLARLMPRRQPLEALTKSMAGGPGGLGKLPGARPDQYGPAGMPKATGINDYAEAPGTIGDIERYLRDKSQKRVGISDVTTPTEEADLVPELENPDKIGIGGKIALGASNILEGMLAGMQGRTPRNMDSISDVEQGRRDRRIRDIELDRELAERRKVREQAEEDRLDRKRLQELQIQAELARANKRPEPKIQDLSGNAIATWDDNGDLSIVQNPYYQQREPVQRAPRQQWGGEDPEFEYLYEEDENGDMVPKYERPDAEGVKKPVRRLRAGQIGRDDDKGPTVSEQKQAKADAQNNYLGSDQSKADRDALVQETWKKSVAGMNLPPVVNNLLQQHGYPKVLDILQSAASGYDQKGKEAMLMYKKQIEEAYKAAQKQADSQFKARVKGGQYGAQSQAGPGTQIVSHGFGGQ